MKIIRNLALFAAGIGIALFAVSLASSSSSQAPLAVSVPAPADQEAFVNAAENTINGVVSVKNYQVVRPQQQYGGDGFFNDPFFDYFFGNPYGGRRQQPQQQQQPDKEQLAGMGSGVIITTDGYIVTNNHVIDGAQRVEIVLNDNQSFDAEVIGADANTDLALLKIDAKDLHVIPMGDSEKLRVGEWVLAVGNPMGLTSTVTSGIVSAKGRNISEATGERSNGIQSYIQTDAALNAGNSGGALVNLKGELVGINAAIYSRSGQYTGYSFAIPTSIVTKVVDDLKKYGTVQRAMLGISYTPLSPEFIKEKDIKGTTTGLYVGAVSDMSAAKEAGIKEGDVLVALNGHPTNNTAQVQEALAQCSPGQKVTLEFFRDGKKMKGTATLRNTSGKTEVTQAPDFDALGCVLATLSKSTMESVGISHGVQVKQLSSGPMRDAGINNNFIILSVNGTKVTKPADVERIYKQVMESDDDKVLIIKGVYPDKKTRTYAVNLEN